MVRWNWKLNGIEKNGNKDGRIAGKTPAALVVDHLLPDCACPSTCACSGRSVKIFSFHSTREHDASYYGREKSS